MKILMLLLLVLMNTGIARASCVKGDILLGKGLQNKALEAYSSCAIDKNDPYAQYVLGILYERGTSDGIQRDLQKALFYLNLSAENGFATAQVELAKLLITLSTNRQTDIISKHEAIMRSLEAESLSEEQKKEVAEEVKNMLLPFTWVILAADKQENKWFLPAGENSSDEAYKLYQLLSKHISLEEQKQSFKEASLWKQRKILETAREVLTPTEYTAFVQNSARANTRKAEMQKLQNKIKAYLQKPAVQSQK